MPLFYPFIYRYALFDLFCTLIYLVVLCHVIIIQEPYIINIYLIIYIYVCESHTKVLNIKYMTMKNRLYSKSS